MAGSAGVQKLAFAIIKPMQRWRPTPLAGFRKAQQEFGACGQAPPLRVL